MLGVVAIADMRHVAEVTVDAYIASRSAGWMTGRRGV